MMAKCDKMVTVWSPNPQLESHVIRWQLYALLSLMLWLLVAFVWWGSAGVLWLCCLSVPAFFLPFKMYLMCSLCLSVATGRCPIYFRFMTAKYNVASLSVWNASIEFFALCAASARFGCVCPVNPKRCLCYGVHFCMGNSTSTTLLYSYLCGSPD